MLNAYIIPFMQHKGRWIIIVTAEIVNMIVSRKRIQKRQSLESDLKGGSNRHTKSTAI